MCPPLWEHLGMASASHRDAWFSTPLNKWCRVSRRITRTLSSFPEVRAWPENAGYPAARVILATRRSAVPANSVLP